MTDKELDKLVQEKLAQQTFEYDDAYWQQAEALIDAQRANNAKLGWAKFAFYFAAIGIFTLMGWFLLNNNKSASNKQLTENKIEKNTNSPSNDIEKEAATLSENKKEYSVDKQLTKTIQPEKSFNNNVENKGIITPAIKHSKENFITKTKEENNSEEDQNVDQEIIITNLDNDLFLASKNVALLGVNITEPMFDFKSINFVKSPNSYKNNQNITGFFNASFEVGTNSFNQVFTANSFGYYVGGRLYFDLGKLSFNTNLHYENINQNMDARTYTTKTYDFTSNTSTTSIKNQSINYAIVGLNAMYPVYKNHSLGLGAQYAQLIQSNDLMSIYNMENNTTTNKNVTDYNSVLNKNDWQLTINYQFRFAKHFAANAAYVYGLNEVSSNLALSNKEYNNRGLKLGLQYIIK